MGSGTWSADVYDDKVRSCAVAGISSFNYSDSGLHADTHPDLDARGLDGKGAVRESRDSTEHPLSTPVAVLFDVTGSMRDVPRHLQAKLPQLLGLLLRKGYVTDPQILFGAIGDATCDRAPLQVGQFESDNRMEDHLGNLLLEGGGGGGMRESYELALWFAARRVVTDAWEKRGSRGFLFLVGDEMAYRRVSRAEVERFTGETVQADIPLEEILAEVQQKWDVYYLLPGAASHSGNAEVAEFWRGLLGQNFIEVPDTDAVPETIAQTIGMAEGVTDLDAGLAEIEDVGSAAGPAVAKALALVGSAAGSVAVAAPPGDLDAPSGNTRL